MTASKNADGRRGRARQSRGEPFADRAPRQVAADQIACLAPAGVRDPHHGDGPAAKPYIQASLPSQ